MAGSWGADQDNLFQLGYVPEDDEERSFELGLRIEEVNELLRRSGYYHSVINGDAPESYWEKIADRIPWAWREIRHFRLLDGCKFAQSRFEICNYSIVQLSTHEIEALGPPPEVGQDFYPDEKLDSRLAKSWMLADTREELTGYLEPTALRSPGFEFKLGPIRTRHVTEIAAGISESKIVQDSARKTDQSSSSRPSQPLAVPMLPTDYLRPILALLLYDHRFFQVPLAFISEAGWKVIKFSAPSYRPSIWNTTYEVDESAWPKFETFIRSLEAAFLMLDFLAATGGKPGEEISRRMVLGTKHYLKATFAARETFPGWMPEYVLLEHPEDSIEEERASLGLEGAKADILLNYVVSLEALLVLDRSEPLTETVATRSALFAGRNDDERRSLHNFVKRVYRARSDLVHAHGSGGDIDLVKLRKLCQRIIGTFFLLISEGPKVDELLETLRRLHFSEGAQATVRHARDNLMALVSDSNSLA